MMLATRHQCPLISFGQSSGLDGRDVKGLSYFGDTPYWVGLRMYVVFGTGQVRRVVSAVKKGGNRDTPREL